MGQTNFTPKVDGNIFYATEYTSIVQAINNLEAAINMSVGSQLAQIPNASLASGINASKIDPSTSLGITNVTASGNVSIAGKLTFGSTGYIELRNGTLQYFKLGPTFVTASDGTQNTFYISNTGAVSLIGHVETDVSSKLRGELTATGNGTITGVLSIGGSTGLILDGPNKIIDVGVNGKIKAGNTIVDASGIQFTQGTIDIKDAEGVTKFSVGPTGVMVAGDAEVSGTIHAVEGDIGGINIGATGISVGGQGSTTTGFSLGSDGYLYAKNGSFTGNVNASTGTLGDLSVIGSITGNGFVLGRTGLQITQGSINLGGDKFIVDNYGNMTATSGSFTGHVNAQTGSVTGTFTAGNVTMSPTGLVVGGANGVKVTEGVIELYSGESKILTLGKYGTGQYGVKSTNFEIDKDGNVSLTGSINAVNSTFSGTVNAIGGNFANVNITGSMVVGVNGSIVAGTATIDNTGIHLTGGTIDLGNFVVDSDGNMTAVNGQFTGTVNITGGNIEEDLTVGGATGVLIKGSNGTIIAGGTTLSSNGLFMTEGTINIGNGAFTVNEAGDLVARNAEIRGSLEVMGAQILGNMSAGAMTITPIGIEVRGTDGIKVIGGNIVVLNASGTELIKIGSYDATHGMYVTNGTTRTFVVDNAGNVSMAGDIDAKSGKFSGDVQVTTGKVYAGTLAAARVEMTSVGIKAYDSDNTEKLSIDAATGKLTATDVVLTGEINAKIGTFSGGVTIGSGGSLTAGSVVLNNLGLTVGTKVVLTTTESKIAGIEIGDTYLQSSGYVAGTTGFRFNSDGSVYANSGAIGPLKVTSGGIFFGTSINASDVTFRVKTDGSAFFKGAINIDTTSTIGSDVSVGASGKIIAGTANQARVEITQTGIKAYKWANNTATETVSISSDGSATFTGAVNAEQGNITGQLTMGANGKIVAGNVTIDSTKITVVDGNSQPQVIVGAITGGYGVLAGDVKLDASGLSSTYFSITGSGGTIGGIQIGATYIQSSNYASGSDGFKLTSAGVLEAHDAILSGKITSVEGVIGGINIGSSGLWYGASESVAGVSEGFYIKSSDGSLNAMNAKIKGNIETTTGKFSGAVEIGTGGSLYVGDTQKAHIKIDTTGLKVYKWDSTNGQALTAALNLDGSASFNGDINAGGGTIGGITIGSNKIFASTAQGSFTLNADGRLQATKVDLSGDIKAQTGYFGTGFSVITIGAEGVYTGSGVGQADSVFYISNIDTVDYEGNEVKRGGAYFRGGVKVEQHSVIDGGELALEEGSITAGVGHAKVKMGYYGTPREVVPGRTYDGPFIVSTDEDGAVTFEVTNTGAYIRGDVALTSGSIEGSLSVGATNSVVLNGPEAGIFLYDKTGTQVNRVVRLDNLGLYVSGDGGQTYAPAVTGEGLDASVIHGMLTIADQGAGAAGIVIKQYNDLKEEFVDNVYITPAGITIMNGALTVWSEQTGEVLIGGGFLRVKGLDMGVVTSNNFVGNGNFNMVSEGYGLVQLNQGEVFLGKAHSSGGATSNPTYHYVGWPDHGERGPHEVWTYTVNADGTIDEWDPTKPANYDSLSPDYNPHPVKARATFNSQWIAYHPVHDFAVVPNDACNWIVVLDRDGNYALDPQGHPVNILAGKGGLFGADFTKVAIGGKYYMVTCGDDIDRKRSPYDIAIFDVTSPNPWEWTRIGIVDVGEFPSKVACDDRGFAYITVSTDSAVYKIDIVNQKVVGILQMPAYMENPGQPTQRMIPPAVPQPICINHAYTKIYVGGVVSDYIYEIPWDFETQGITTAYDARIKRISTLPYPINTGKVHDIVISPDDKYLVVANASTTDGTICVMDITDGRIETWMSNLVDDATRYPQRWSDLKVLAAQGNAAAQEELDSWNWFSSTGIKHHPTKKIVYVSVTNRCAVSVLDYTDYATDNAVGQLKEVCRVESGTNVTAGAISREDGNGKCKLYVPNHHYHTYPIGMNRIWSYDTSRRNFYDYMNPEWKDTTQKFWHYNPSGTLLTSSNRYLWIANRATNNLEIIDTQDWSNTNSTKFVEGVGNKPYFIIKDSAESKVYVANDDANDQYEPDIITIVDVNKALSGQGSDAIDGTIQVGDSPIGLAMSHDDQYLYVACSGAGMIQKVDIRKRLVIESGYTQGGNPRFVHYKYYSGTGDEKLFVTCFDTDEIYIFDAKTMHVLAGPISTGKDPTQITVAQGKIYVVCQGEDVVRVYDETTYSYLRSIDVGSMPKPIAYNPVLNKIYVGNAGSGSAAIINATTDQVEDWVMTGDNVEFISVSSDGVKWYASAHGPKDVLSYGMSTPFTGDAYLDNNSETHKYGASYWMPKRSQWWRAEDNTLTSFSSVEFWPTAMMHDKQGYAHMTVMGVYDAYAQIEQDLYALQNNSEGASEVYVQTLELKDYEPLQLEKEPANFSGYWEKTDSDGKIVATGYDPVPGPAERKISLSDNVRQYIEGTDYFVDYDAGTIRRYTSDAIPPSKKEETLAIPNNNPVRLMSSANTYNTIEVYPSGQTMNAYNEDVDYVFNRSVSPMTIARKADYATTMTLSSTPKPLIDNGAKYNVVILSQDGTVTYEHNFDYVINADSNTIAIVGGSRIAEGATVQIKYCSNIATGSNIRVYYRHILKARYYYYPNKRNYSDMVLSADFLWRWPRPENQWVSMEIDEMIPRFVVVDNDQLDPWMPKADGITRRLSDYTGNADHALELPYKGLVYSGYTNRATTSMITTSATPTSGAVDSLKTGSGLVTLPTGEQYVQINLGARYYVTQIDVIHANDGRQVANVKVQISENGSTWTTVYTNASESESYIVTFPTSYQKYKSGNLTETEVYNAAKRAQYVRCYINDPTANVFKQIRVMGDWKCTTSYMFASSSLWDSEGFRETYLTLSGTRKYRFDDTTIAENLVDAIPIRYRSYYTNPAGEIQDPKGEPQVKNMDETMLYIGIRADQVQNASTQYDYVWDQYHNTIRRTSTALGDVCNSRITDGQKIRLIWRYAQEDMSQTPMAVPYRNPETGQAVANLSASVAETDVTGAWIEWDFDNQFRCDWWTGWVSDVGMGAMNVYLDNELVHSISLTAAKTERYSQLANDLLPGRHKIRVVQQQGRVNFDLIKLEDYQKYNTVTSIVASPLLNPVELFNWHLSKLMPIKARKYLGRGTQIVSGAYDTPRTDMDTKLPNNLVPIKYRVRFKTELKNRGTPKPGDPGSGGELGDRESRFERGSVMITGVNMEKGVNPTYWRMAPGIDKYTGFAIEAWDPRKPNTTGIQNHHLADGIITPSKIKSYSITDKHIASNARIQEHKLLLNYPTHPHLNLNLLDQITQAHIDTLNNMSGAGGDLTASGNLVVEGDLSVNGELKLIGQYSLVHQRPIFGIAGDLEFNLDGTTVGVLTQENKPFTGFGLPAVATGASRYYRLYAIWSDNVGTSDPAPKMRLVKNSNNVTLTEWTLEKNNGTDGWRRDGFSPYFQVGTTDQTYDYRLELYFPTNPNNKWVEIHYVELRAYDKF